MCVCVCVCVFGGSLWKKVVRGATRGCDTGPAGRETGRWLAKAVVGSPSLISLMVSVDWQDRNETGKSLRIQSSRVV